MAGEQGTGTTHGESHKRRKFRRRKKRRHRQQGIDVAGREKLYLIMTLFVTAGALVAIVGWGLWTLTRWFLDGYR